MFEQLVRPFQSRQVTTTRRIVPAIHKPDEKPNEARITWGSTGQLPPSVVQPKATNLENIESVGFNVRGSIDNWNQSVREGEQVTIPVRDNSGNQIGETVVDRTKSITYTGRVNQNQPYLPNFGHNQNYQNLTGISATAPDGLRGNVPSADTTQSTYNFTYP